MLGITDDSAVKKNKKRKRKNVTFNDEECVINPEDVDPNVGRFRNLVQTTVVPTKRTKIDKNYTAYAAASSSELNKHISPTSFMPQLYQDLPPLSSQGGYGPSSKGEPHSLLDPASPTLTSKLGLLLPNPAPEVTSNSSELSGPAIIPFGVSQSAVNKLDDGSADHSDPNEPKKKKYAKEAWPGRKPLLSGL